MFSVSLASCTNEELNTITEDKTQTETKTTTLDNKKTEVMNDYQTKKLEDGDIVAVMKTTNGTIQIKLFTEDVPKTTLNFMWLAQQGYYDGIIFHRVIKNFMIQWGDPEGTGRGGKSIYGAKFDDEFSDKLSNIAGSISMANSGVNSNGSQFFINQVDNTGLDFNKWRPESKHSVFGQIVEGMDTVNKIAKVQTAEQDRPVKEVKIISLVIKQYNNGTLKDYSFDLEAEKEKVQAEMNKAAEAKKEADKDRVVETGNKIAVHYTLTLENGEKVDSSIDRWEAFEFNVGAGMTIKGFDDGVLWMKISDKKTLTLAPKDAYGEAEISLPKAQFKSFEDAGIKLEKGAKLPTQMWEINVLEVSDDTVTIENNHDLAGKTLIFDVEMIEFKD